MQNILWVLACVFLISCGVKEAPSGSVSPQIGVGNTPIEGVLLTVDKKFLIKPSRSDFVVESQFKVTYQIVDRNLEDLKSGLILNVKYEMPDMPQMPVTPAIVERVGRNTFTVTLDISMEGAWDFVLTVEEEGKVLDTLKFSYEVAAVQ